MEHHSGYFEGCDGTRLFYQTCGQGPDIVACNGIGVSTFFWKYMKEYFSSRFRFTTWDYRGHGRSELPRDRSQASIEILAADLKRLLDHLQIRRPVLLGHSMGVQVILEFYRSLPTEVGALVPVLGSYGRPLDTLMGSSLSRPIFDRVISFAGRFPRLTQRIVQISTDPVYAMPFASFAGMVDRFYCPAEDLRQYLEHLGSLDTPFLLKLAVSMADHSARDVLPHITVPTLIVAGERDLLTPIHLSFEMRALIPNAEMLILRGGSHAALVEQPEVMCKRLEEFLRTWRLDSVRDEQQAGEDSLSA